jgi:hypothetical protein
MPDEQRAARANQKTLRASAVARAMPRLAAKICRAWKSSRPRPTRVRRNWRRRKKGAARSAARWPPKNTACEMLEQDIQDNAANATRFLVLGRQCSPPTGRRPHEPDGERGRQGRRAARGDRGVPPFKINMTKIESRPSKRKAWEYFFFIDCDGHFQDRKWPRPFTCSAASKCNFVKNPRLVSQQKIIKGDRLDGGRERRNCGGSKSWPT